VITVRPRVKSSLLWSAVGALAFLALVQGYDLLAGGLTVGFPARVGVALLVGAVVAAATYVTEHRLARKGRT
jgi:hypothetical protein